MNSLMDELSDDGITGHTTGKKDLSAIHYIQQILDYSLDMICTTNIEGRFTSMSAAVEKILDIQLTK